MQTHRREQRPVGGAGADDRREPAGGGLGNDPIVRELRKLYDGIVEEPVPDQLMDLLRKLDEVERKR